MNVVYIIAGIIGSYLVISYFGMMYVLRNDSGFLMGLKELAIIFAPITFPNYLLNTFFKKKQ